LQAQPQLPKGTVLLQYFPGENSLYIQAMTRERTVVRELTVSRQRVYELIRQWRSALQNPAPAVDAPSGAELSQILLDPVAEMLQDQNQVLILPTGDLWYLPWESLPGFAERHSVAYLSAGDLRGLALPAQHPVGQVVAVGNPQGADLPATRGEIENLCRLFPGTRSLQGDQARQDQVKALAGDARILHFATHSQVSSSDWNASFLKLSDGPLQISQVYGWKLPKGALVVLSSCQSAYGQAAPGREVASLARAFHFAGAGAVVASLWPVDDEATAALFGEFYRELVGGASPGLSLQRAQARLRSQPRWARPCYWAGFVLQGDPR
jgi:CHAT domain-containing protein